MPKELNLKSCDHVGIKTLDCEVCCNDYLDKCIPVEDEGEGEYTEDMRVEDAYEAYVSISIFWSTAHSLMNIEPKVNRGNLAKIQTKLMEALEG